MFLKWNQFRDALSLSSEFCFLLTCIYWTFFLQALDTHMRTMDSQKKWQKSKWVSRKIDDLFHSIHLFAFRKPELKLSISPANFGDSEVPSFFRDLVFLTKQTQKWVSERRMSPLGVRANHDNVFDSVHGAISATSFLSLCRVLPSPDYQHGQMTSSNESSTEMILTMRCSRVLGFRLVSIVSSWLSQSIAIETFWGVRWERITSLHLDLGTQP